jgi:aerobic-type carbon monoxide dehydrogenase small subunit (CoxS/CutS family)
MPSVRVNGTQYETRPGRKGLLSFLRFDLGLTGTKYGCGEGLCGSCTVLVDGQPLRACMATLDSVLGGDITTIEGLAGGDQLHPVQIAFLEESAMQCGYCTPGMIMTAAALLARVAEPDSGQIREALAENLCRCGVYQRIECAVGRAAAMGSGGPS